MAKRKNIIYKIFYGDNLVYIGRTTQYLQSRIHNHFFKPPTLRLIDINLVSKIEFAEVDTTADMYVYEVYYINKFKPILNTDAKAEDSLTLELPELIFSEFPYYLMDKWKVEIRQRDIEFLNKKRQAIEYENREIEARSKARQEMSQEEYLEWQGHRPKINFKTSNKDW